MDAVKSLMVAQICPLSIKQKKCRKKRIEQQSVTFQRFALQLAMLELTLVAWAIYPVQTNTLSHHNLSFLGVRPKAVVWHAVFCQS